MAHHIVGEGLSPETLRKVHALRASMEPPTMLDLDANPVENLLAEFGDYYGWDAMCDVMAGRVNAETFLGLLAAGRRRDRVKRAARLRDMYEAVGGANTPHGNRRIEAAIRRIIGV